MRFVLQRQLLISDMIFVAYDLNLPLNMEKPHYRSQRAGDQAGRSVAGVIRMMHIYIYSYIYAYLQCAK